MTRFASATVAGLIALAASAAGAQTVLFSDDFDQLPGSAWQPATNGPWQVGEPQSLRTAQIQGRGVVVFESQLDGRQRRGLLTTKSFRLTSARLDVTFLSLSERPGVVEAWLLQPFNNDHLGFGLFGRGDDPQSRRARMYISSGDFDVSVGDLWTPDTWYTLRIDVRPRTYILRLLDDRGGELWAKQFPFGLCQYGRDWEVGVMQYSDDPLAAERPAAAVDRVLLTQGCAGDFNGDEQFSVADFTEYLIAFQDAEHCADLDSNGVIDLRDLAAFQNAFARRCW